MRTRSLATMALVLIVAACNDSPTDPAADQIQEVRRLTEPFRNVSAAQAAGYAVWSPDPAAAGATCASSAEGKMGYHLVNVGLRGSPANPAQGENRQRIESPHQRIASRPAQIWRMVRPLQRSHLVFLRLKRREE